MYTVRGHICAAISLAKKMEITMVIMMIKVTEYIQPSCKMLEDQAAGCQLDILCFLKILDLVFFIC